MDERLLRRKLKRASLVIGDVGKTVRNFRPSAPIGFIAFDLDYYTSTKNAMQLFSRADSAFVPRVFCYFDDTVCEDDEVMCESVGGLLAIREFNESHPDQKMLDINGLTAKRPFGSWWWCDQSYALHRFGHPLYNIYIGDVGSQQVPL